MTTTNGSADSAPARDREAMLALEVILTDANRLRARGRLGDAVAKCKEAISRDGGFWQAYELMGDILRQQGRPMEAIEAYKAAKALNRERTPLEDKIARVCARLGLQAYVSANAAQLASEQRARNPVLGAFLSLLFPGLGQLYNRHYVKAMAVLCSVLMMLMLLAVAVLKPVAATRGLPSVSNITSAFLSGQALYFSCIVIALWIYAVIDAAAQAARPAGLAAQPPPRTVEQR